MTDPTTLMPGPELMDVLAQLATILGYTPTRDPRMWLSPDGSLPIYFALGDGLRPRTPHRQWNPLVDPASNADVERWLMEQMEYYVEVHIAVDGCTWHVGNMPRVPYPRLFATARNDEASTPIAARLLAVCRFAVRVAGELKKVEVK